MNAGAIAPGATFDFKTGPTGAPATWVDGTFTIAYHTPEPASMLLLGTGLLGLAGLFRRR